MGVNGITINADRRLSLVGIVLPRFNRGIQVFAGFRLDPAVEPRDDSCARGMTAVDAG